MKYRALILSLVILAVAVIFIYQPPKEQSKGSLNDSSVNNIPQSSVQLIASAKNNKQPAWLLFHSTT